MKVRLRLFTLAVGIYSTDASAHSQIELALDRSDIVVTFKKGWHSSLSGEKYIFACDGYTCENSGEGLWSMSFRLMEDGNILVNSIAVRSGGESSTYTLLPISRWRSSESWTTDTSVDSNGNLVATALISNPTKGAKLRIQCSATSTSVRMLLNVNTSIWSAIQEGITEQGYRLEVQASIGNSSFLLDQWELQQDELIVRLDDVSDKEIARLKQGERVYFDFYLIDGDEEELSLGGIPFTLKGSSATLSNILMECQEAAFETRPVLH